MDANFEGETLRAVQLVGGRALITGVALQLATELLGLLAVLKPVELVKMVYGKIIH